MYLLLKLCKLSIANSASYQYIGCYIDDFDRLLDEEHIWNKAMSADICFDICTESQTSNKHQYFGTQMKGDKELGVLFVLEITHRGLTYTDFTTGWPFMLNVLQRATAKFAEECFCRDGQQISSAPYYKRNESECSMPCVEHEQEMCGGSHRISVYKITTQSTSANNVTMMNSVDKPSLSLLTTTGTSLVDNSNHASITAVVVSVLVVVIVAALVFMIVVIYRKRKIAKNSNSSENRQKHSKTDSINAYANKTGITDINMPTIYENISDNKIINLEALKREENYETLSTNRKSAEHMNSSTEHESTESDLSQYQSLNNRPESDIHTYDSTDLN